MSEAADRAHALAAALTSSSSSEDVLAALSAYKEAFWSDRTPVGPGTIAWFMVVFLPEWVEAQRAALDNLRIVAEHGFAESQHMLGDWLLVMNLVSPDPHPGE